MATTGRETGIMAGKGHTAKSLGRRAALGIAVLCVALTGIALSATSAFAGRSFEGDITGFSSPHALTVDGSDNLWVSDTSNGLVTTLDSSGAVIDTQNGGGKWSPSFLWGIGVNNSTGWLYVADSNFSYINVFDQDGAFVEQWEGFGEEGFLHTAVDNSGGSSAGRVYVSQSDPGLVIAHDPNGDPVNFTHSAPYISGSQLTGTPGALPGEVIPFSSPWGITTDEEGNVYVIDSERNEIDKFAPSGEFLLSIKGMGVPGGFTDLGGVAVDPTNGNVLVIAQGEVIHEFEHSGDYLESITEASSGVSFGFLRGGIAVDSEGEVFVSDLSEGVVHRFGPNTVLPIVTYGALSNETQTSATVNVTVDPLGGGDVSACKFEYGLTTSYGSSVPCSPAIPPSYSGVTAVSANIAGLATEQLYHYRVVVTNSNGVKQGGDRTILPRAVATLKTEPATSVQPTTTTLNGSWEGKGEDTDYYFQWGLTDSYGNVTPVKDGGSATGKVNVSESLTGLNPATTYHYRIVATNSVGTSFGQNLSFKTNPNAPIVKQWATDVHSDSALIWGEINPGGGPTGFHVEYVDDAEYQASGFANAVKSPPTDLAAGSGMGFVTVKRQLFSLSAGTTYHYRVTATNAQATSYAPERVLHTFPFTDVLDDPCPNALARKQTGAALLLDCRAYELVSAADTGGYNVESDLVQNQTPYPAYPWASAPSRVLYSMFDGGIPGTGHPTNRGRDPYLATRGSDGWSTEYVGIPANNAFASGPFRSVATDASNSLDSFAFSDPDVCSPCFAGGGTGIPIRTPSGQLLQGMVGSIPQSAPVAAGDVRVHFSPDGNTFLFGSTTQLEADGNDGSVSIYARDLGAGETHVVSKTPGGATMTGSGIAALDVSEDGSRVLIGRLLGTDAKGNELFHLYMNVDRSPQTIDLMPSASAGAIYAGMSSDGSKVLFTTKDALASDTDTSSDLYRADVTSSSSTLARLSSGNGAGDSNSCAPPSNWNTPSGGPNCDVVAIAGGGGIATGDGSAYFFSPEDLDGSGVPGQPNLYLAAPGANAVLVATLEASNPAVTNGVSQAETRSSEDFQVTADGGFAAFASTLALQGEVDNAGFSQVYRYASQGGALDCVSCSPTGVRSEGSASLAAYGLSISDAGDVFFSTGEPLAPRDLNGRRDAYQWKEGEIQLISTGASPYHSGLLSVTADGTDAYFFTRDNLAPQDENGQTMKVYDARSEGGFFVVPPRQPCAASDECHGPSSPVAPPPSIGTFNGTGGQVPAARKRAKNKKRQRKGNKRRGKGKQRAAKNAAKRRNHG